MHKINVRIANRIIGLEIQYLRFYNMCRDFEYDGTPELYIHIDEKDQQREYDEYINQYGVIPSKKQIEIILFLRKVADSLIQYNTVLFHGAAISCNKKTFLFMAPSGTGKTTHILQWLEKAPDTFVVNGDKPFIILNKDGTLPLVCSSPWAGKENLYTNTIMPLNAIVLLERAEENHIQKISFAEAFPFILQQIYHPENEDDYRKTIQLIQQLRDKVTFWRFQCNNFKEDCFDTAYKALIG